MKLTKSKLKQIIKEEMTRVEDSVRSGLSEGGELQNTAKGAVMSLLDTAKSMEQAPSHEPASMYAQEVGPADGYESVASGDGGYGAAIGEAKTKRRS